MDFYKTFKNKNYLDTQPSDFIKSLIFYVACIFILSIIVYILYNATIKTIKKESMSPSSRWNRSARYLNRYNGLLPQNKQYTSTATFPPDPNHRGDHSLQYLLKQEAGKPQSNGSPDSVNALGISTRTAVPDTSALPAAVQSGVVENASEVAQYTNPRTNPTPAILNRLKLSPAGNLEGNHLEGNRMEGKLEGNRMEDAQSRVSEGFRKRRRA
jgi:hypothetical protein